MPNNEIGDSGPARKSRIAVGSACAEPDTAMPCKTCGTSEISWVNDDCAWAPAPVAAWPAAADCACRPAGLVVWGGGANEGSVVALADTPA